MGGRSDGYESLIVHELRRQARADTAWILSAIGHLEGLVFCPHIQEFFLEGQCIHSAVLTDRAAQRSAEQPRAAQRSAEHTARSVHQLSVSANGN